MDMSSEEAMLLSLLKEGEMDGDVGEARTYRVYSSVRCGKYIEDGIPITYREGRIRSSLFDKEDNKTPIMREEEK